MNETPGRPNHFPFVAQDESISLRIVRKLLRGELPLVRFELPVERVRRSA